MSMGGACVGFLWWNAAPARIIMGDTGSLSIGTGLACLALVMNVQLLLPIIGGLFVIVTMSVVIQVISFRVFHRRVFLMAPLHHHFELRGWPETTVTVRFWIFSGLCTALGVGPFLRGLPLSGVAQVNRPATARAATMPERTGGPVRRLGAEEKRQAMRLVKGGARCEARRARASSSRSRPKCSSPRWPVFASSVFPSCCRPRPPGRSWRAPPLGRT